MSTTTPFAVSTELDNEFKNAVKEGSGNPVRYFHVQIKQEKLEISKIFKGTASVAADFDEMQKDLAADQASYFLFRVDSNKSWLLITVVPDGVPVKEKMTYASAKNHLKDKLGHPYFNEELHFTSKADFSYAHYQGEKKPIDSRSAFEKEHQEVLKQEEEARDMLVKQQEQKEASGAVTGGYHSVVIPLSDGAKTELNKLKDGTATFVQLFVNESKDKVNSAPAKNISSSVELQKEILTTEPRFYIFKYQKGVSPIFVFIYCCPEKSPAKLRMVYSTSKPTLADSVSKLGLNIAGKRIEITDPKELTDDFLRAETSVASKSPANVARNPARNSMPAMGGTTKATKPNTIQQEHPVYALLSQGNPGVEKPSGKKKIVIPPRGAY